MEGRSRSNRSQPARTRALLDRPLAQLCNKGRLLDLIRNFGIFDAGHKKVPRPHQFLAVKTAQERIAKREGGVIWHTQGSGKSILMVLLAKWLLEHDARARVLIVTDRDELDKQIEGVMRNAGVLREGTASPRVTKRAQLLDVLAAPWPRLVCTLLHKIRSRRPRGPVPTVNGQFFGTYIHTYNFHEGVADGVILDLKYEARDVPQKLGSRASIDTWFEASENEKPEQLPEGRPAQTLGHARNARERQRTQTAHHHQHHPGLHHEATPRQRPRHRNPGRLRYLRCLPYFQLFQQTSFGAVARRRRLRQSSFVPSRLALEQLVRAPRSLSPKR